MTSRPLADLETAWVWRCECGAENVAKSVAVELLDSERSKFERNFCADVVDDLRRIPANVRCKMCGKKYRSW